MWGQTKNLPLNHELNYQIQQLLFTKDTLAHGSLRPLVESMHGINKAPLVHVDSGLYYYEFTQKLWKENLFTLKGEDYKLTVDPLGNFRGGHDISDTLRIMFRNSRAIRVQGDLGSNFSFETFFYENQAKMPRYIDLYSSTNGIMPGEGRAKRAAADIIDFGYTMGYISYSPNENWNFQLGHGKQFLGNGYRSMLLSDVAFNYPYIRSTWNFGDGKFQYSATYAQLSTLDRLPASSTPEATFKRKFGNFHYLSYRPSRKLEVGLFEGATFQQYVEEEGTVPLHFSAYSPIIGTHLGFNGFESTTNTVIGLNLSYNLFQEVQLYGQLAMDNPAESKLACQAGVKATNAFGVRQLYLQAEFNQALANTYTMGQADIVQSWSHMGQPLAHPLGANFMEIVGIAYYEQQKFYGQLKFNSAVVKSTGEGYSNDLLFPDELPEGEELQSYRLTVNVQELQVGHRLNVKTNMTGFVGVRNRVYAGRDNVTNSTFIFVGIRTNLNNLYYDF